MTEDMLLKNTAMRLYSSGGLYQIGVPLTKTSIVMMVWPEYKAPMVFHPSTKNPDMAVREIRHDLLADKIVKLIPVVLVNIVKDNKERIIKI